MKISEQSFFSELAVFSEMRPWGGLRIVRKKILLGEKTNLLFSTSLFGKPEYLEKQKSYSTLNYLINFLATR
jgi:hypothetical protein